MTHKVPKRCTTSTLKVELPKSLKDKLQNLANQNHRTLTGETVKAIETHLLLWTKELT